MADFQQDYDGKDHVATCVRCGDDWLGDSAFCPQCLVYKVNASGNRVPATEQDLAVFLGNRTPRHWIAKLPVLAVIPEL